MPRSLGMVIGTVAHQVRSLDCWKIPAKGTESRLMTVIVRVH